jgi:hypothetical protein
MSLFGVDLTGEKKPVREVLSSVVREDIKPVIQDSIKEAEGAISRVIGETSKHLDEKIDRVADEIHNQRNITKQEIEELIDYAAIKFSRVIDERVTNLRQQVSDLVDDKARQLKDELENAAVRSRRQLWMNASVAVGTSASIALVAVLYRKLGNNEIDLFTTFRIIFMSMTLGSAALLVVKLWRRYDALNAGSKNMIQVVVGYAGMFRPNRAGGLFALTFVLALIWALLTFYQSPLQMLLSP